MENRRPKDAGPVLCLGMAEGFKWNNFGATIERNGAKCGIAFPKSEGLG